MSRYWKVEKPQLPYYAVIFASTKSDNLQGFAEWDEKMLDLAMQQPGFLGYETVGNPPENLFISYWQTPEDIDNWRHNALHRQAKQLGHAQWYDRYLTQICKVEHAHEFVR